MKRQHDIIAKGNTLVKSVLLFYFFVLLSLTAGAQEKRNSLFQRVDSMLTLKYRKGDIDTAYITRPQTKWTLVGRLNVSGAKTETEGVESDRHFNSEMTADYKSTISFGVSYLGLSVNMALNPAKLMGKYHDYEININSYGKRYGFDFIYQDARNFSGWTEWEDMERLEAYARKYLFPEEEEDSTIDQKVESYRAELEAEAVSEKSEASRTTKDA